VKKIIDLRSDTVTRPTPAMLKAMVQAEVGDDVFGEDPTVRLLEMTLSENAGMEAGLFVSSGTQSNLLGIMSHCDRGDEYISGQDAHVYRWEAGGAAVLGSVQPQPVEFEKDGTLDLNLLKKYIKPDDCHHARTKLLCLENTQGGKVVPLQYIIEAKSFAKSHGLRFHLDGARVFNASVKLGVPLREITQHFDSVSICLSKSLGAPVGSVLCGSQELINKARRLRKMVGGSMRQAGILAAAGLYALEHHVNRLADDHTHAQILAEGLSQLPGLSVDLSLVHTNMVFVKFTHPGQATWISQKLRDQGIVVPASQTMRMVTHLDISIDDIHQVISSFEDAIRNSDER
jgi:threonine aldolase